jgi:hypothetical protein
LCWYGFRFVSGKKGGERVDGLREHESELTDAFSVVSPGMFRIRRRI